MRGDERCYATERSATSRMELSKGSCASATDAAAAIVTTAATVTGAADAAGAAAGEGDGFAPRDLLELFLGLRHTNNVPGWSDWLTMPELARLRCLSRDLRRRLATVDYPRCRDGHDYRLPYPGLPGIAIPGGGGLFPHQLASLRAMQEAEHWSCDYGALRGGILGDAPGLGKTITMLSLVASTAGHRVVTPARFWDESGPAFAEAWAVARRNEATAQYLSRATSLLRRYVQEHYHPASPAARAVRQALDYAQPPYADDRFPTVRSLEQFLRRRLRGAVPPFLLEQLRQQFVEFRTGLDKRSRRRLAASAEGRHLRWERGLVPACATLIVVPDALLEHWGQQIHRHLDVAVFAPSGGGDGSRGRAYGVVYLDGFGDMSDIMHDEASLRDVNLRQAVAPPWELSQYLIVLTTFSRCELQLRNEEAAGRVDGRTKKRSRDAVETDTETSSPFLKIRWLRLVVDEGHELGKHPATSGVTRFLNQVAAERRWVLSGTPMTGNEDDMDYCAEALFQLQRLLYFLRHPDYGHLPDDHKKRTTKKPSKWQRDVLRPFLAKQESGRAELLRVLKSIMVMHRKEDIHLPSPVFLQAEREVPVPKEMEELLLASCAPGRELIASFNAYLHSSDFQSLVDQTQAEYIIQTLREARQELSRSGFRLVHAEQVYKDTRPVKAVIYSAQHNILLSVTEFVLRQLGSEHVAELYASEKVGDMNAELSRFRHGVKECKACPICGREESRFSVMESGTGCSNQLMEVLSADGLYRRFLIEPERIRDAIDVPPSRMDGEPLSAYSKWHKFWRVGDRLLVDIRDPHPVLAQRLPEQTWYDQFGSGTCKELAERDGYLGADWYFGALPDDPEESGLLEVTLRKWQACGRFHSSRWYRGPRLARAPLRKVPEDVFLLALDASLSHGLDLSFVTHIFLLEPIDDAALLEQVTSRAHRIGAGGPVLVETVNADYKISEVLERALDLGPGAPSAAASGGPLRRHPNRPSTLESVVCEHCYRSFPTRAAAEEHERTLCLRNPANAPDLQPFHLSSVYREIKPPPAVRVEAPNEQTIHRGL